MTTPHPKQPGLILFAICVVALMSTAGIAMPYPILAPIFVDAVANNFNNFAGLPPKLLLGIALAVNPLGILIGSTLIGVLSDRLGRRKVLISTLVMTFLCYLLTAYALWSRQYILFVLARFLTGLTEGNVAIARAIVADLHPQLDRTRSFAILNSVLYSGWLIGPLIGGLTLPLGEAVPFLLAAGAMLVCLSLLIILLPETGQRMHLNSSLWQVIYRQHAFRLLSADPLLARLFWTQLSFAIGLSAFYEFYPLWLVEFAAMGSQAIALVTAMICAVLMFSSLVLVKRWGKREPLTLAAGSSFGVAIGLLMLALFGNWPLIGVMFMVLLGLPIAIYNALLPSWCAERFAHLGQGSVMGLLTTVFCLANVLVALLGSVLTLLDTRLIMVLGAVACVLAALRLHALAKTEAIMR